VLLIRALSARAERSEEAQGAVVGTTVKPGPPFGPHRLHAMRLPPLDRKETQRNSSEAWRGLVIQNAKPVTTASRTFEVPRKRTAKRYRRAMPAESSTQTEAATDLAKGVSPKSGRRGFGPKRIPSLFGPPRPPIGT
jgi:hypothetical protein